MASVRVEFVKLGSGSSIDGAHPNIVEDVYTTATNLTVTATATTAGSRPVVPSGYSVALVTAIDDDIIVSWGADPTADQTSGHLVVDHVTEALTVSSGQLLSFILLA